MEDTTLKKYFDDLTEKIDYLRKTVDKIDDRQSSQYKKIIEHEKELIYLKEKIEEEKLKDKEKFDIVHAKFRRSEKNTKWWVMALLAFSASVSGIIQFFMAKPS